MSQGTLNVDADLAEVLDIASPVAAHWNRVSINLGLSSVTRDIIKKNHPGDVAGCLTNALEDWLKLNYDHQKHGKPSWKKLAEAVKNIDGALYERIIAKKCTTSAGSNSTNGHTGISQAASAVTMAHLHDVVMFLQDLDNDAICGVGSALGLNYPKMKRMSNLPADMVTAWIRGDDSVATISGNPTWASLAKALEAVGHKGIAARIRSSKNC